MIFGCWGTESQGQWISIQVVPKFLVRKRRSFRRVAIAREPCDDQWKKGILLIRREQILELRMRRKIEEDTLPSEIHFAQRLLLVVRNQEGSENCFLLGLIGRFFVQRCGTHSSTSLKTGTWLKSVWTVSSDLRSCIKQNSQFNFDGKHSVSKRRQRLFREHRDSLLPRASTKLKEIVCFKEQKFQLLLSLVLHFLILEDYLQRGTLVNSKTFLGGEKTPLPKVKLFLVSDGNSEASAGSV